MTRKEYDSKIEDKKYSLQQQKDRFVAYYHIGKNYIKSLEATIEAQEIIIKDKSAIMEAMAQPKSCYSCSEFREYTEDELELHLEDGVCLHGSGCAYRVYQDFCCSYYEPKAQP